MSKWDTVKNNLPTLLEQLEQVIETFQKED